MVAVFHVLKSFMCDCNTRQSWTRVPHYHFTHSFWIVLGDITNVIDSGSVQFTFGGGINFHASVPSYLGF